MIETSAVIYSDLFKGVVFIRPWSLSCSKNKCDRLENSGGKSMSDGRQDNLKLTLTLALTLAPPTQEKTQSCSSHFFQLEGCLCTDYIGH